LNLSRPSPQRRPPPPADLPLSTPSSAMAAARPGFCWPPRSWPPTRGLMVSCSRLVLVRLLLMAAAFVLGVDSLCS
jgi:hypothetical protein